MELEPSILEGVVIKMFDAYSGKSVLITGDTGFKGSWLSIWLHHLGARVIGVALPPTSQRDNYVQCDLVQKIDHYDQDIRDYAELLETFRRHEPDVVFHLAAQALVLDSYSDPIKTFSSNVLGTVHVLEAIRHTPSIRAAVMVTSDKCYENREWIYGYRERDRFGGRDPYSASKGACEIVISSYQSSFFSGKETTSVASARAGNVMGGGDWSANRIVPDCIRSLEKGEPIKVRNPSAVRPWLHVLEPLSGYLTLGERLLTGGQEYSGGWNFGPEQRNMITVRKLAERCVSFWGEGTIEMPAMEAAPHEAHFLHLDISKAINLLNWRPKLDFDSTVRMTIEEYRSGGRTRDEVYEQRVDHIERYMSLK